MKIYLAATYSRHAEMRGYRSELQNLGHKVTSRWIDVGGEVMGAAGLASVPATGAGYAEHDLEDIRAADVVIVFTDVPSSTGGLHVELGYAFGLGKQVIISGPRTNVFHALPEAKWYPGWAETLRALR
jgi:nucleoside 2-deoxyribosyltransferase